MDAMPQQTKDNNGFALVVVLFSLAVIGILFAVASTRTLTKLQESATERTLIVRHQSEMDILNLAIGWKSLPENQGMNSFEIELNDNRYQIRLLDVGGLIDLNTASPELLGILFDWIGASQDAIIRFRDWRRSGNRLQRVSDLFTIAGIAAPADIELAQYATVFSGRRGVAIDEAPSLLVDLIKRTAGPDADTDSRFASAASNVNFLVVVSKLGSRNEKIVGTIHVVGDRDGRILE